MALICNRCKLAIAAHESHRLYNRPNPATPYHFPTCPNGARPESKAAEPSIISAPSIPVAAPEPLDGGICATCHNAPPAGWACPACGLTAPRPVAGTDEARVREIALDVFETKVDVAVAATADAVLAAAPTAERVQAMVNAAVEARAQVIRLVQPERPDVVIEGAHFNMRRLVAYVALRRNVYLYGQPGSGKTYAAKQVAEAMGLRYGYISLTAQTLESRILGAPTIDGGVTRTPFRECYEHGGVFCIDELDNASANFLTALNGAIENGLAAFPDGLVKRHADFILICGGNTKMRGGDTAYPERRPIDAATIDRFVYIDWPVDNDLERTLALGHNPAFGPWVTWMQTVRAWASQPGNDPKLVITPRATYAMAQAFAQGILTRDEILGDCLWKGIDAQRVARALAACPYPA